MIFCKGSISEIYQAALSAVAEYSSLEDELNQGILGDWDLNHLLIPLARFFGNSVLVLASIFNVVTGCKTDIQCRWRSMWYRDLHAADISRNSL